MGKKKFGKNNPKVRSRLGRAFASNNVSMPHGFFADELRKVAPKGSKDIFAAPVMPLSLHLAPKVAYGKHPNMNIFC